LVCVRVSLLNILEEERRPPIYTLYKNRNAEPPIS